jgi:hypothetical protein
MGLKNRRSSWARRGADLLGYLVPLLVLGLFYLPVGPGPYVFWRNWVRAGCGPVAGLLPQLGFDPNDLPTYAAAFACLWSGWLLTVLLSPLHRIPPAVHGLLGFGWCFTGWLLTLAI